jgi:hypothetical protein
VAERKAILNHVRRYHTRKKEITKNISTYLESIGPLLRPDHVPMPVSGGPLIPFLKTKAKAYECNKCQEVHGCLSGMKTHLGDMHRIHQSTESSGHWIHCTAQTISPNHKAKYFRVVVDNSSPSSTEFQTAHLAMGKTSDNSFASDSTSPNPNVDEMIEHCLQKFGDEEKKRKEKLWEIECQPLTAELTPVVIV